MMIRLLLALRTIVRRFLERPGGTRTSRFGVLVQLLGVGVLVIGIALWSTPLALIVLGLLALFIGERL